MIFLDEQMIGFDAADVTIRHILVCGGLLSRLSNGRIIGAHFDPGIPAAVITAGLNHIQLNWFAGGLCTRAFFFCNLAQWRARPDALALPQNLSAHLRAGLGMAVNTEMNIFDKTALSAGGVDIRGSLDGVNLRVDWRPYVDGIRTPTPTPNVACVLNQVPPAVVLAAGYRVHTDSPVAAGWTRIA